MANNWAGGRLTPVAVWGFNDAGGGTVDPSDSVGGNDLTPVNTPGFNNADQFEGDGCTDLESTSSEKFTIADSSLDSGFPTKSGETNKKFSVCGFFQPESTSATIGLVGKYSSAGGTRSWMLTINTSNQIQFFLGYNSGASFEVVYTSTATFSAAGRYHYGLTFDDSDKSYKLVVWRFSDSSKIINASGNSTNNIAITTAQVEVGAANSSVFDGLIDEVVVFDDILTTDEIDQIRAGTYGAGGGGFQAAWSVNSNVIIPQGVVA